MVPLTRPVDVPLRTPATTTAWPTNRLGVVVQEHWPAVPVTITPASAKPLESDVTFIIRAAALSVTLPLIGHDRVLSAESVISR